MLKARDMMTKDVVTVTPDTEITQAARLLLENHFNGLPVVDDKGRLIGIICQDDLIVQQKRLPLPSLFTFFDGIIPLTSYRSVEKEVDKILASKVSQARACTSPLSQPFLWLMSSSRSSPQASTLKSVRAPDLFASASLDSAVSINAG